MELCGERLLKDGRRRKLLDVDTRWWKVWISLFLFLSCFILVLLRLVLLSYSPLVNANAVRRRWSMRCVFVSIFIKPGAGDLTNNKSSFLSPPLFISVLLSLFLVHVSCLLLLLSLLLLLLLPSWWRPATASSIHFIELVCELNGNQSGAGIAQACGSIPVVFVMTEMSATTPRLRSSCKCRYSFLSLFWLALPGFTDPFNRSL